MNNYTKTKSETTRILFIFFRIFLVIFRSILFYKQDKFLEHSPIQEYKTSEIKKENCKRKRIDVMQKRTFPRFFTSFI